MGARTRENFDDELEVAHEINVTPFIDVMLVLLIIFMIAAPLATVDVAVDLPGSTAIPAERPPEPVPGDREALALGHFDGLQVALADDDALALGAMSSLLASWGCEVTAAHTADELLDAVASGSTPDILITDLRLGGTTDGLALIAAVRSQPGRAELPAVLISGDTAPESLARIQATGVPMLHKPVRPARLRALMHRLLTDH